MPSIKNKNTRKNRRTHKRGGVLGISNIGIKDSITRMTSNINPFKSKQPEKKIVSEEEARKGFTKLNSPGELVVGKHYYKLDYKNIKYNNEYVHDYYMEDIGEYKRMTKDNEIFVWVDLDREEQKYVNFYYFEKDGKEMHFYELNDFYTKDDENLTNNEGGKRRKTQKRRKSNKNKKN